MYSCCVPICPNSSGNTKPVDPRVSFHPFPRDVVYREQWFEALGIVDPVRFRWKSKAVCSSHFLPSEVLVRDKAAVLTDTAIPSICELEEDDGMKVESAEEIRNITPLKDNFCRICFRKYTTLFPLSAQIHNMALTELIYLVSGVRVKENEYLPGRICSGCMTKVDFAFNVRLEFQLNAQKLRTLVKEGRVEKYFEQYRPPDKEKFEESYADRIMHSSRDALVERKVIETSTNIVVPEFEIVAPEQNFDRKDLPDMVCIGEEHFDDVQHLIEQDIMDDPEGLEYEEIWDEEFLNADYLETLESEVAAESQEELIVCDESDREVSPDVVETHKDQNTEKKTFVFSWMDLVKPKKKKTNSKPVEEVTMPELIPNNCYVCNKAFASEEVLEEHLTSHVAMLPHKCKQCSTEDNQIILRGMISLNRHLLTHLHPYACPKCPLKFPSEYSRYSHVRWTHLGFHKNGFTCETCGKTYDKKRTFLAHVLKHRTQKEERFKCEQCNKLFTTKASLERHLRTHTGECPFECPYCGKRFNHEYNFRQHKLLHLAGNKIHRCEHCPKAFVNSTSLRYHMAEHFPDDTRYKVQNPKPGKPKEHVCTVPGCEFVANNTSQLVYHRNSRHLRKFRCEPCGRQFVNASVLQQHEDTVHRGIPSMNRYPCTFCDKTFSTKTRLDRHEDVHRGKKNHFCRFCEKGFVQKINCVVHERVHTKERPYKCRMCAAAFADSGGRKKHELNQHSRQEVTIERVSQEELNGLQVERTEEFVGLDSR